MSAILKVKMPDGSVVEILAIKGADGHTPVKGIDYWTDEDKAEIKGADGYTPQRGIDYCTDADKAEIKSYVDEAILGGAW
jgi:hypothetical protein